MPRRNHLLLVGALVMVAGCTRPVSHAFTTQTTTTQAPVTAPAPEPISIRGAGFHLHAAGPVGQPALEAAWAGVLETLNRYLEAGVLTPLRSGGPAGDLTPLLTRAAVDRVMTVGPDRFAFIDENLPAAVDDVRAETAVATLHALAGADGALSVVTADLDLRLSGSIEGERLTVVRTAELVLMPDGGPWQIDAWDIKATRTLARTSTTTTARS